MIDEAINKGRLSVVQAFKEGATGALLNEIVTDSYDKIIKDIFARNFTGNPRVSLVALGGYGRREMSLYSDIDLLFLHDGNLSSELEGLVSAVIYPLWNASVEVTNVTRSVPECLDVIGKDPRALTSMTDARLLCGERELFEEFKLAVNGYLKKKNLKNYIEKKLDEYLHRLKRYGESVYVTEPHLKEGEGGLRCYHAAWWLIKARFDAENFKDIYRLDIADQGDLDEIYKSLCYVWRLRHGLHYVSGRKQDRLLYDAQEALVQYFVPGSRDKRVDLGQFMHQYYKHASRIHDTSEKLIGTFSRKGLLERIGGSFNIKFSTENNLSVEKFKKLLSHPVGLDVVLTNLEENGMLSKIIPEFKRLYHRVQYDPYHVYTIDVHTIFTIREISFLAKGLYKNSFPPYHKAYSELRRPEILVLSCLLHDIGKGNEEGIRHDLAGAGLAATILSRLGYNNADVEAVSFLVRTHLLLSRMAFSRDVNDPHLLETLAELVKTPENLRMLYLLTFADIRATGPELWNNWKGELLTDLYNNVGTFLKGRRRDYLEDRRGDFLRLIDARWRHEAGAWLDGMPERYLLVTKPEEMSDHFLSTDKLAKETLLMETALQADLNYHDVTIITKDSPGLFARICSAFFRNRLSILEAQLNTGKSGDVIDRFKLVRSNGTRIGNDFDWDGLKEELLRAVLRQTEMDLVLDEEFHVQNESPIRKRRIGFDVNVIIDNDISPNCSVFEISAPDKAGLLYKIALLFYKNGLDIYVAKALTQVGTALDVFYVRDAKTAEKLEETAAVRVREKLLEILG